MVERRRRLRLRQTLSDLELLVIDDGSIDETADILASYRTRDQRVTVIKQAREGFVAALNRGLAHAKGALIARLDDDDVAAAERLQRQVSYLNDHQEVVLLGTWGEVIDGRGRLQRRRLQPPANPKTLASTLPRTNPFIHSSVMFRAAIARQLGGYRKAFDMFADYDLWLRLSEAGEVANLPKALVQYRQHGGNVSRTKAVGLVFASRRGWLRRPRAPRRDAARGFRRRPGACRR